MNPRIPRIPMRRPFATLLLALVAAGPASAGLPPEGHCPTVGVSPGGVGTDAVPQRLQEGSRLSYGMLAQLRDLLPREIWQNRQVFFYPGMQMLIGGCHRRYPFPRFWTEATRELHDGVQLDAEGNLRGYRAGLPFPPQNIDPRSPDTGVKWAWNLEHRFRGAGPFGSFRIADIPGREGNVLTYRGFFFFYQTRHRADLAATDYTVPGSDEGLWAAGGRFLEPFNARHLAWLQIRPEEAHEDYDVSDRTFVYVPTMRKVRRAATNWVDGMYVPRYRVAGDSGGGGIPIGGDPWAGPSGAINPGAAESVHQTENLPRGFTALALRPNAYVWRFRGEQEVLAPLNVTRLGYPMEPDRDFGPYGLSIATDRWDVRWAVVIEGRIRVRNHDFETLTLYIDYQTQQPLFAITKASKGRILDVGMPVHRFSGDVVNYPGWANGERASVFDPVAEIFYRVADDTGWRRESYNVRSTPAEERIRRRFTSTDFLIRGR
jgi:hypothetical protein